MEILKEVGGMISELWSGILVPSVVYASGLVTSAWELVRPETAYGEGMLHAALILLAYKLRHKVYGMLKRLAGLIRVIPVVGPWLVIQGLRVEQFIITSKDKVVAVLSIPLAWCAKIWSKLLRKDKELEAGIPAWKKK